MGSTDGSDWVPAWAEALDELGSRIRDAGRVPVERDTLYNVVWSADEELAAVGSAAPVMGAAGGRG